MLLLVCFEGLARLSHRVWRRFVRGSREVSLVSSLHGASTNALISLTRPIPKLCMLCILA